MPKREQKMNIIIKIPNVIEKYAPYYENIFSEEGYKYFQRYLSGLLLSENKTVVAINRLFVIEPRNQSSFNRFLNRQNFDLMDLEKRNIDFMQESPATAFKPEVGGGVLSIDDTLLSHYGKHIENIYNLWDHVYNHYTLAHNLVSLHYSDNKTDYPIQHTLWDPPDWDLVAQTMRDMSLFINELLMSY